MLKIKDGNASEFKTTTKKMYPEKVLFVKKGNGIIQFWEHILKISFLSSQRISS